MWGFLHQTNFNTFNKMVKCKKNRRPRKILILENPTKIFYN